MGSITLRAIFVSSTVNATALYEKSNLITIHNPFNRANLAAEQQVYNNCHCRARWVGE